MLTSVLRAKDTRSCGSLNSTGGSPVGAFYNTAVMVDVIGL